jgi:hypothetical protein
MTSKQQVIVTIGPDGGIEVEADGIVGRGCEALTRPFEEALGTVTGDTKKPEWTRDAKQPQQQRAGQ